MTRAFSARLREGRAARAFAGPGCGAEGSRTSGGPSGQAICATGAPAGLLFASWKNSAWAMVAFTVSLRNGLVMR